MPEFTSQGDKVISEFRNVFEYGKELVRERVFFYSEDGQKHEIFDGYKPYIYGFSFDGNYFVFTMDAGVTILKRNKKV